MYIVNYTCDDFKSRVKDTNIVILPIGSVEAHGHHLPLGTDIFSPRLFCSRLDERIGEEIWIAPEIPYGQSYDLSVYPGTINVPSEVLAQYVYWVGKGFYENGLNKLLLLNGHGGNINALGLACEKLAPMGMDVMMVNWWLDFSKEILTVTEGQGHAGEDETSAILYYNEKLVHMDKAAKNDKKMLYKVYYRDRGRQLFENALTGDATLADREKGEKIFEILTNRLIDVIHDFRYGIYISR